MKVYISDIKCRFIAVLAVLSITTTAWADLCEWSLSEGQTIASGSTFDFDYISLTFGEDGASEFKAAVHDWFDDLYQNYTPGNDVNGDQKGGTFYVLKPRRDGYIQLGVRLNSGKKFYIEENGVPMSDFNGITVDQNSNQYYGIWAKSGNVYKIYAAGSKLGFYGFRFDYSVGVYDSEVGDRVYLRKDNFTYCWHENESFYRDKDDRIIYQADEWGGLVSTYNFEDWSEYEKVVFEFEGQLPVDVQIYMDFGTSGDEVTKVTSKGATTAEFSRGNLDWSHVHALVLQPSQKCTLKINSIYLVKRTMFSANLKYHEIKINPVSQVNTSLVDTSQEAWGGWWQPDESVAPLVTTADGRQVKLVEQYSEDVNRYGELMCQEINNLPNGEYEVQLYANSCFTEGRGFDSNMKDYANDVAYVFANGVKQYITCRIQEAFSSTYSYTLKVKVTMNKLRIGMGKEKPGTNWHTIQIKSLKLLSTDDTPCVELVGHTNPTGALSIPAQVNYGGKTYNVVRLAPQCLVGCGNVSSLMIPEGVEEIGWQAFIFSSFTTINIPSTVYTIGDQVFNVSENNTAINVDAGNQWFCSEDGILFSKEKSILYRYPQGKTGESYVIPNTVRLLVTSAFENNKIIRSITIPQSLTDIWWGPFQGCTNLMTVINQARTPHEFSDELFDQETYSKGTLYVPSGCISTYKSTNPWSKFKTIKDMPTQVTVTAKSYEITYGDALPNFDYDVSDYIVTGTPKITCSATKGSPVGTYDILIEQGSMNSSATLTFVKGKLTIKKATLTISAGNYTKKEGDPMPTFKVVYSGFKNNETESVLTKKPTITCSATATSAPGQYPITLSGASATNYNITYKNGTLTVTKADDIVVTAKSYTISYGDAIPTLEFTSSGGTLSGSPKISCSAGNVGSRPNAGVYDIIVEKGTISNYKVTYVKGTLTVKQAPLTVSVGNYTKKQGDPMPTFKLTYSGFKMNETESVLTKKPTISCSATATSAPGDYPITLSGATATNYSFTYKNGTLTVTKADAIVVTAKNYTINYGDAIPTLGYTTSGGTLSGTPTISCSAGAVGSRPDAGVYDIVVEKGSVSNFNVSYVKGTLTVKKVPLTVSVGDYSKYEGEDMPKFTINYSGFKKGDTKNSLTRQPVASCEANKWSPAGSYSITLSGGESPNYDFSYKNGTLTVKHVYSLTIMSQGNGSVKYGSSSVTNYQIFDVKEGTSVKLTFVPNDGYKLSLFTVNGEDVTSKVTDNTYSLGLLTKDVIVVAGFTESTGNFRIDGITYSILSAPEKKVVVGKSASYHGHVNIPETITYSGEKWKVVGVANNAFNNCSSLVTVTLPQSMKSENMGLSLFTGCTKLAAIVWNADFMLTTSVMGTVNNPNLLFYTKNISYSPKGVENVIGNGKADKITLYDATAEGDNFYCPIAFKARKISYSHSYTMESAYGGVGGWETLALPFTVQKITHERVGDIVPFAVYDGSRAPFWLYTYSSSGFIRAKAIEANVPYIICMPNNNEYDAEYRLSGRVTFSAQNAVVEASDGTSRKEQPSRGNKTFVAAYKAKTRALSTDVYAMNVVNERYSETGSYTAGSIFINNLRTVAPFEAVMTTSSGSAASRVIDIDFNETTGIESLPTVNSNIYNVYNLNGQLLIQTDNVEEQNRLMNQLPAGVYIVNGKKMIINK